MFSICKSNPISLIGKRILGKLHNYCTEPHVLCITLLEMFFSTDVIYREWGGLRIISNIIKNRCLIIFFMCLIIFRKTGLVFRTVEVRGLRRGIQPQKSHSLPAKTCLYPFACIARAYILICLIMARSPLERVGERCSVKPISRMK